jgi:cell fate regulator YaaT (PSP1 superfamily)
VCSSDLLAAVFRTRIELRQIGVRDEAKMLGGIGPCGRVLCCSSFLGDFEPVSIKMAKDQNLSLNPTKISGLCGRLMCCLKYENDNYEVTKDALPDIGDAVFTPDGQGQVMLLDLIERKVRVQLTGSGTMVEHSLDEVTVEA